jgi:hypothetical protein
MRDMRNVAAEKTTPLRLDPDPARACSAPIRRRATRGRQRRARTETLALSSIASAGALVKARGATPGRRMTSVRSKQATASKKSNGTPTEMPPIVRNPEMRRRRVKLPEAMREIGVDEPALAETLAQLLWKRRNDKSEATAGIANDKLVMDLVKECARMLEVLKSVGNDSASDAPAILRLTHNIPRPVREGGSAQ